MRRRGLIVFLVYFFSCFFGSGVSAIDIGDKFLQLPLMVDWDKLKVLQGWLYTVKLNGSFEHGAMDYDCEPGEHIFAAADGIAMTSKQISAVTHSGYGNFVFVRHTNGYATLYGHLSKPNEKIKTYGDAQRSNIQYGEWTQVKKGDYIGECGMSGTDNVHLHFEVTTGKYAVGRVDSYDLYKTKEFYPPHKSYITMGEKNLWLSDPPSFGKNAGEQSVLTGLSGTVNTQDIVQPVEKTELTNLSFVDKKINISSQSDQEMLVVIHAKNTGTTVWNKNKISLNVVGGVDANQIFRHTSWITNLRPTLLDQSGVKPGDVGSFSFSIRGLSAGVYTMTVMAVEVGTWKQIGDEESVITITIEKPVDTISTTTEATPQILKPLEGVIRGIKDFADTVVDVVTDVIQSIPKFFGYHGEGSASGSFEINESPNIEEGTSLIPDSTSTNEVDNSQEEHSLTNDLVIPGESNTSTMINNTEITTEKNSGVMFNEIAWSGSSGVCTDHEWIELYNTSSSVYSLDGWTVNISDVSTMQTISLAGVIEGHSYYLIAHPNTFVSIVKPDVVMAPDIRLVDSGGKLVLKNQEGEVVDSVEQSQGWFGGNTGQFPHTLERVSSDMPSASSSNWKTSNSVRYGISSGNCGYITGSPRMANVGYAYLSNETLGFYPRNNDGVITLDSTDNPYVFSNITIPPGEKIIISPGVVLIGANNDAQINVQGELDFEGSENFEIVVTSRNDRRYVRSSPLWPYIFSSSTPQAGDWQNIVISDSGKLNMNHTVLTYGGNRYGASGSCQLCSRSQVITNEGGELNIINSKIEYGYKIGSTGSKPDTLLFSSGGYVALQNVEIDHGKRAIHSEGNAQVSADTVVIHDFDVGDNVVYFATNMPEQWSSISYTSNTPTFAYSPSLVVTSTYILSQGQQFKFGTVLVNKGATLIVDKTNLYTNEIKINGEFDMNGETSGGNEIAGSTSPSSTFSHMLFSSGSGGNITNVTIRGGGYLVNTSVYPFTSPRPYMIWIDGAEVKILNSQLIDSKRPGGIVVVRNGSIDIRDSELGWNTVYNKLSSYIDYGMVLNNQSVGHMENVNFRKMDYVVELNQGSTLTYDRMSRVNFIDLYPAFFPSKNWFPTTIFPF